MFKKRLRRIYVILEVTSQFIYIIKKVGLINQAPTEDKPLLTNQARA